jgi:hypothetical protein
MNKSNKQLESLMIMYGIDGWSDITLLALVAHHHYLLQLVKEFDIAVPGEQLQCV